jgi:tetratricopeptide (TPR) repeat protein
LKQAIRSPRIRVRTRCFRAGAFAWPLLSALPAILLVANSFGEDTDFREPDLATLEPGVRAVLEEGLAELRGIQSSDENSREAGMAWGELGMLYQAHHLQIPASACYQNALRLNPQDFKWPYLAGYLDQEAGRLGDAMAAYEDAIGLNPGYLPITLRQGQVLAELQRPDDARKRFLAVITQDPRNAPALAGMGRLAMTEKDYAGAIRYLEQALAFDPAATRLRYTLAIAYRQSGHLDKARDNLRLRGDVEPSVADPVIAAMARRSRSAQLYLEQGYAAAKAGRDHEAVIHFRKAVEFSPNDASALVSLGQGLARIGDNEEAMRHIERALEIDPDNGAAHYRRGTLLEISGDDAEATGEYRAVLASDPRHLRARFRLANGLMRLGEFRLAAEQYESIETTPEQEGLVIYSQGLAELAAWQCEAAIGSFERALALRPNSGEIHQALARSYATCPAIDETRRARALVLAQQLIQARRNQGHAETLAMAAAANGRFQQALQIEQQLLDSARQRQDDRAIGWHEHLVERHTKGEAADRPWPLWHPVYNPASGNAGPGSSGNR